MNGYELSRGFVDWAFENPSKIRPIHYAVFFFAIEHCNRLGWKEEFGLPSYMVMEAIGVKKHSTFSDALKDLEDWGFVTLVQKSKNQYTANIITLNAMPKNGKAHGEALDKARSKHREEQREKQPQGTVTIDKQVNHETLNPETTPKGEEIVLPFDSENFKAQWQLWKAYKKKQHRFTYKHEASEQAALTSLSNMATGQERKAISILHYTMANGWKGFVVPKDESTSTKMTVEDILNGVN